MTIISMPKLYKFNGVEFEVSSGMPWPLKADGDPKRCAGSGFYKSIQPWIDMAPELREAYRVGGGCIRLD